MQTPLAVSAAISKSYRSQGGIATLETWASSSSPPVRYDIFLPMDQSVTFPFQDPLVFCDGILAISPDTRDLNPSEVIFPSKGKKRWNIRVVLVEL